MFVDRQTISLSTFRDKANDVISPIQVAINFPIQWMNHLADDFGTQHALAKENVQLHEQLLFMKADMQRMLALQSENAQLKELLQSSARAGGHVIQAQILAVAPDPYLHQVILDKGLKQGVYIGQPVLDAHGVMGQVIQAGQNSSRVILITDNMSSIPIQDTRSGVRAIVSGNGSLDTLRLHNVTQTMDLKEGDLLITSGLDQHYPYGYPVGTISKMHLDPAGQFVNVWVRPAARFHRSRLVMLVWPEITPIDNVVNQGMQQDEKAKNKQPIVDPGGVA